MLTLAISKGPCSGFSLLLNETPGGWGYERVVVLPYIPSRRDPIRRAWNHLETRTTFRSHT